MKHVITWYSLPKTLIRWPMMGCRTHVALALSHLVAAQELVLMSNLLFQYWLITCMVLFGGRGSSILVFTSQVLMVVLILPVALASNGVGSHWGLLLEFGSQ